MRPALACYNLLVSYARCWALPKSVSFDAAKGLAVEEPGYFFLLGTDKLGRDIFSRILYGARVSLTIGLVGVALSFILGCLLGGISGFYGGVSDTIIQRLVEYPESSQW